MEELTDSTTSLLESISLSCLQTLDHDEHEQSKVSRVKGQY